MFMDFILGNSPPEAEIACGCLAKEGDDFMPSGDEYCLLSINEIINGKVNISITNTLSLC